MEFKGWHGWAAVGAVVAVTDVLARETMSEAFKQARESENLAVRALAIGGLVITAAHLLDLLPEQIDPFDRTLEYINRSRHS